MRFFYQRPKLTWSSYPNAQMNLGGYDIHRKDRKKGGGGLMAYFSTKIASRQVKLLKQYKLIEELAIKATINNNDDCVICYNFSTAKNANAFGSGKK